MPQQLLNPKVASTKDFPGFIWSAEILILVGVKDTSLIKVKIVAVSFLIPDVASPPNNYANLFQNLSKKTSSVGIEAFKLNCSSWSSKNL